MSLLGDWAARSVRSALQYLFHRQGLTLEPRATDVAPADNLEHRLLLHVGCGHATIESIPSPGFRSANPAWKEIRLDADMSVAPDIVGTMTDMRDVPDGSMDAVFSSHGIEHLFWHDVPKALAEFHRVLAEDGFAAITCPDLQAAAAMIAEDRVFDVAYVSPAGPITPFDIVFSYRPFVQMSPEWMPHRCGFTLTTLTDVLRQAGFSSVLGHRRPGGLDLWVVASKSPRSGDDMETLARDYLAPAG